ncbi:MAG: 16S rRNA (cytosine(967)-C(5))-methyltransferase [Syntrophobacteraceae bacterium]|nr:16S rRNA (cytosine(967)-C(5))-methyltransferase [Syntrophobacteraceae bacterium]
MNAREIALKVLQEVEAGNRKSEVILNRMLEHAEAGRSDRALARELVSGTIKFRRQCDFVISKFYRHDYAKAAPVLKNILRIGVYQLLHLDRVPRPAAVDECVKLARKYKGDHLSRLVNGVLRKISPKTVELEAWTEGMEQADRLAVIYSYPTWLVSRWLGRYGGEITERMLAHGNQPPATAYRINRMKGSFDQLAASTQLPEIRRCADGLDNFFFTQEFSRMEPMLSAGLVSVQNPAQGLACLLAAPEPGSVVYDMCAAPGGKSTFMAELMNDEGRIIALDRSERKLDRVASNAKALGITIIEPREGDALTFEPGCALDIILLDAPCTGTGVLGRRAELRWRTGQEKLDELVELQRAMLDRAATLLQPGGILVYATCSLETEENEQQLRAFLARHPEFVTDQFPNEFPESFLPAEGGDVWLLTLPGDKEGFDGGFAARLRKKELPG